MPRTIYPSIEEAQYLHDLLISKFGGSAEILDHGLLESALSRPRSGYYNSLSEQAAALMQSLALNHCFADGNKRIAFALTASFLLMNDYRLKVDASGAEKFIVKKLIGGKAFVAEIAAWLENYMKAV